MDSADDPVPPPELPNGRRRANPTRALLGRGSLYAVAQAIQLGSALLVVPFITRILDPNEYGQVATGLVATRVLAMVVGLGLPSAVTLEYFRDEGGGDRARRLLVASIIASVVLTVLFSAGMAVWQSSTAEGVHLALQLAIVATAPLAIVLACQALLQAQNNVRLFVLLTAISTLGGQALGLVLTFVLSRSAAAYFIGLLIGYSVAAMVGLAVTLRSTSWRIDRASLRDGLKVGTPTVPHAVSLYVLALGDRIVIERISGFAEVGRYDVAYQIGALSIVALVAYNQAWAPIIYEAHNDARWSILSDTTTWVLRLVALVATAVAFAAPAALLIAAPSSYRPLELTAVAAITAISVVPYALYLSRVHVIFQERVTHNLAWATPLAAVIGIGACAVFVPRWGLAGAALSTIVGYSAQALFIGLVARRHAPITFPDAPTIGIIGLCTAGVVVACWMPSVGAWLALRIAIGLLLGVGLLGLARHAVRDRSTPFA